MIEDDKRDLKGLICKHCNTSVTEVMEVMQVFVSFSCKCGATIATRDLREHRDI